MNEVIKICYLRKETKYTNKPSAGYGAGIGFYVAIYPILPEPIGTIRTLRIGTKFRSGRN